MNKWQSMEIKPLSEVEAMSIIELEKYISELETQNTQYGPYAVAYMNTNNILKKKLGIA